MASLPEAVFAVVTLPFATLPKLLRRLTQSAVVWSWAFNFLRLASGLLLLPLLLRLLTKPDLGMYYVFLSLAAITMVLDFGMGPTMGRFINYAMGGATRLAAHGLSDETATGKPNYPLLWELLLTGWVFYRYIALATLTVLGALGTFMVWQTVEQTSWPPLTWLAWGLTLLAAVAEIYFNFWNIYLRSINQVLAASRIMVAAYALRLVVACVFLLVGGDLVSLPAASLVSLFLIRSLSRQQCLRMLSACPRPAQVDWRAHFRTLWPNTWRLGLHFASCYLSTNANVLLCSSAFGLDANAAYGLSLQVGNISIGMASVWLLVKWPLIGQMVARRETEPLRRLFCPRLLWQVATLTLLLGGVLVLGSGLLRAIGTNKQLLPTFWLALMMTNALLEAHCTSWTTLISLGNRIPMLWPSLITHVAGLALNFALVHRPGAQAGWLALGPLVAGVAFTYWYWPRVGAHTLELNWAKSIRCGFARSG